MGALNAERSARSMMQQQELQIDLHTTLFSDGAVV
jgi:hypothetical protein